ncbi:hypothetical protein PO124_30735 [Bacillus licheniformis]|nr:hypothetical protein [Bacillus licheniformis]
MDNNPDRLSGWLLIPPKDGVLKEIKPAPAADWIAKQIYPLKPETGSTARLPV